jgi:hypothetical protein
VKRFTERNESFGGWNSRSSKVVAAMEREGGEEKKERRRKRKKRFNRTVMS